MTALHEDRWTVIAWRPDAPLDPGLGVRWTWIAGWDSRSMHRRSARDEVIAMQRVTADRRELVARVAGPWWRRLQARFAYRRAVRREQARAA